MRIAVDAMGGDYAPRVIVQGSLAAVRELGIPVLLVGDEKAIQDELGRHDYPAGMVEVCHAAQVAGIDDQPVEVLRYKKDASIRVCFDQVKAGQADAVVSAGHSGATLAVGSVVLGRISGVQRPGIAGILPTAKGRTILIDVGANVDCRPGFLFQFGVMAHAMAQTIYNIQEPRVALLSIGEEDSKGNSLVLKTHELFRASGLNFIGNIEGRDLYRGLADVVVCDGFVGNVVLKLSEGAAEVVSDMLASEIKHNLVPRLSSLLLRKTLLRFLDRVDYAAFGGAPLLGIQGVGIISHGRSSAQAIRNAINTAAVFVREGLTAKLEAGLAGAASLAETQN